MAKAKKQVEGVFEKNPGSGVWYVRYRTKGVLVRKAIGTHSEAIAYIEKARTIRRTGEGHLPTTARVAAKTNDEMVKHGQLGISVKEMIDRYEDHLKATAELGKSDVANLRHIRGGLGHRGAASLRPHEIKTWLQGLGLAPATLNKVKSALSCAYLYLIEREELGENPCRMVKHFPTPLGIPRWLSEAEEDKIRAVLRKWVDETPEHHALSRLWLEEHQNELTVAIGTGIRKGNQYALDDDMLDFGNRLILLPTTKPGRPHIIPMTDDVHSALLDQRRIQEAIAKIERRVEITDKSRRHAGKRVFSITENREWWKKVVKEAKLKPIRWHDLRHTTASRLAMAGANQKVIQSVLGHSTLAMSARYTHLHPDHLHKAMSVLNRGQHKEVQSRT